MYGPKRGLTSDTSAVRLSDAISTEVVCATCGRVDDPAEAQARPGRGMPAERIEFMEKLVAGRSGAPGNRSAE